MRPGVMARNSHILALVLGVGGALAASEDRPKRDTFKIYSDYSGCVCQKGEERT